MDHDAQGAKEVGEALLIAVLSAIGTGLVNWGLERLKEWQQRRKAGELADGSNGC